MTHRIAQVGASLSDSIPFGLRHSWDGVWSGRTLSEGGYVVAVDVRLNDRYDPVVMVEKKGARTRKESSAFRCF